MKRNDNIVWLSRDHHSGLLCSWKVRQGVKKEIEPGRIKNYILYFFENHLEDHFKAEEEVLFPILRMPIRYASGQNIPTERC
jgi:iron-sulfur cluster repair protein YtfE (RIC family)